MLKSRAANWQKLGQRLKKGPRKAGQKNWRLKKCWLEDENIPTIPKETKIKLPAKKSAKNSSGV